jgi:hypothetical protein
MKAIFEFEPYDEESGELNCCNGFALSEWQEWNDVTGAESIAFEKILGDEVDLASF